MHTHGAVLFRLLDLGAVSARRRRWRLLRTANQETRYIKIIDKYETRQMPELSHDADQICFWRAALVILPALSVLCFADSLAHIARVSAVESLLNGLSERAVLRIVDHHAGPRDRLQAKPMTSNRTTKCKCENRSAKWRHNER